MKKLFSGVLFITFLLIGCEKNEVDPDSACTSNCTTIRGTILTSNKKPLSGIKLQLKYIQGYGFFGSKTLLKKEVYTASDGSYSMSFNIKDDEKEFYEGTRNAYFELQVDLNTLEAEKYLLVNVNSDPNTPYYQLSSIISLKKGEAYDRSIYIPEKEYIKVNLNNFIRIQENDHFEVQTYSPWGINSGKKSNSPLLDTEYSITFSGYESFVARTKNQKFLNVPVAKNDINLIRVIKLKNGIATTDDHKIEVSGDNDIELTFEY